MKFVECPKCNKLVEPSRGHRCPMCNTFLHPDPIKRREADLVHEFYEWVELRFIVNGEVRPSDRTLSEVSKRLNRTYEAISWLLRPRDATTPSFAKRTPEGPTQPISTRRPYTHVAKVVCVGAVDKTALLVRYVKGIFNPTYVLTIGVAFHVKDVQLKDGSVFRVQLWDTGGQDRFGPIRQLYYRGCKGVLYCFDITSRDSFDRMPDFLKEVKGACGKFPGIMIGSQLENAKQRQVTTKEAELFALDNNLAYYEVDPRTDSIQEAVEDLCLRMLEAEEKEA